MKIHLSTLGTAGEKWVFPAASHIDGIAYHSLLSLWERLLPDSSAPLGHQDDLEGLCWQSSFYPPHCLKIHFFPFRGMLESLLRKAGLLKILSCPLVSSQVSTLQVFPTMEESGGAGSLSPLVLQTVSRSACLL